MHPYYFEGDHINDPGIYLNGKGPYLTTNDAIEDQENKSNDYPALKEFINSIVAEPEVKFLVKVERSLRTKLLAISIWILSVPIFWYGTYKLIKWVVLS